MPELFLNRLNRWGEKGYMDVTQEELFRLVLAGHATESASPVCWKVVGMTRKQVRKFLYRTRPGRTPGTSDEKR